MKSTVVQHLCLGQARVQLLRQGDVCSGGRAGQQRIVRVAPRANACRANLVVFRQESCLQADVTLPRCICADQPQAQQQYHARSRPLIRTNM